VIDAEFHHRGLVRRGQSQEGERHPNVIVEVALRLEHSSAARQDRRHHLLGGGLAVAAGYADHAQRQRPAPSGGEIAERAAREPTHAGDTSVNSSLAIIGFGGRILVWSIVLLVALDNLGINITALLAGLGVGGVAVALALQNVLGDLFASLSIALDKPFVTGDTLEIGEYSGVVERIGIKSLRLRSASGEQIILSNADALKSRIRNFARATERQAIFSIGVPYETALEKLELIPKLVAEAVAAQPGARLDRCQLRRFGDFALIFEVSLRSPGPGADVLFNNQHAINLAIIEAFRRHGINFAYPTQRVVASPA